MSSSAGTPQNTVCPFLGIIDETGKPAPYVEYPSFENRCFVTSDPEAVMLTDQATFCLSSGYRHCPRLAAAQGKAAPASRRTSASPTGDSAKAGHSTASSTDPLQRDIEEMEAELQAAYVTRAKSRRRWGWFGAATIFMSTLLCVGLFAAYLGWQMVNSDLFAVAPGTVDTLASAPVPPQPQVYMIVTATSAAAPPKQQPAQTMPDTGGQAPQYFPPAVTATPASPAGADAAGVPSAPAGSSGPIVLATPPINMQLEIPTRRPTPLLDLAVNPGASTPEPSPTVTPTPSPALGTPVVIFAAVDSALESGDCTTVTWHVENVSAVYYENIGVDGHGEHEECLRDKPGDYVLTIVLPNGATQYYTTTVDLIPPTKTPTPTSTFPPEVIPTATWTPVIPTDTPTPDYQYGVLLATDGDRKRTCNPGDACRISLLLTNTSIAIDNISIAILQSGAWESQICRLDGVCSDSKLTIASVGPGNTALVHFSARIPDDASAQTQAYIVQAISEGSQGRATSKALTLEITVE